MQNKYIAIIQTGVAIETARKKFGDFDKWFNKAMEIDSSKTKTYRVFEKLEFPKPENLAGIIITGSSAMVTEKLQWSEATIEWLKPLLEKEIPILGVCYGHQLLARALGGNVDWNPNGRELGKVNIKLTKDAYKDKLLKNLITKETKNLKLLASHKQSVIDLPKNVMLLGTTKLDPIHFFRYRQHIWGLQFHPEFTPEITRDYIHARSQHIINEGLDPQEMIAQLPSQTYGKLILRQFKQICYSK